MNLGNDRAAGSAEPEPAAWCGYGGYRLAHNLQSAADEQNFCRSFWRLFFLILMKPNKTETTAAIYTPAYVQSLFNEMSATYGLINLITSFGFSARWRRQCVAEISIKPGESIVDLMSGMGELWPSIAARQTTGRIIGIDFSPAMCSRSQSTADRLRGPQIQILQRDALNSDLPDGSADVIVSSFGLKTFSAQQQHQILAREIHRVLRPGGRFSMLEISVPPSRWLQAPYMFYLRMVIPVLGWLLMGNPDNYRMLGIYTTAFGNCDGFALACREVGLQARQSCYFFGCATGVVG